MTWKDILKVDIKEARRLGRKYAPTEMIRDDIEKLVRREKKGIKSLKALIPKIRETKSIFNTLDSYELGSIKTILNKMNLPPSIDSSTPRDLVPKILEGYISEKEELHKKYHY